ncbi:hypothetical protein ACIQW9_01135 [Herminiimonas sp. NPDC097707]|uniref:hypothetical protein n=1 Tax=Herminiimonas sp. NPDC097707 TaxID=3364007 RepID=UPI00383BBE30
MNHIDTEIQHITKPNDNIFLDLGFSPEEAKRYQAESQKQIDEALTLKQQLIDKKDI